MSRLEDWESRNYSRIAALPDSTEPLQRAQLLAALSVGGEIIELRRIFRVLGSGQNLDPALAAIAQGNSALARARLACLDDDIGSRPSPEPQANTLLRARAGILMYWIINLQERRVEVYRDPTGPDASPAYRRRDHYGPADSVPLDIPGQPSLSTPVRELLP